MYLSYSGYKTYVSCPLSYWHKYIAKTPSPQPDNRVNALYGTVVGAIFEAFYNEYIWADPKGVGIDRLLLARVMPTIESTIEKESKKGIFDWENKKSNYPNIEAVAEDVRFAVRNGLKVIKLYKLLGPKAASEVPLDAEFDKHKIGGRADFIIERMSPYCDTLILDGKGSKFREKFVDGTQLRWYAMLYYHTRGKLPDKLGFVYWRSPPEEAVDFIDFGPTDLDILKNDILKTIEEIQQGIEVLGLQAPIEGRGPFQPIPEISRCRLCSYEPLCRKKTTKVPRFGVCDDDDDLVLLGG